MVQHPREMSEVSDVSVLKKKGTNKDEHSGAATVAKLVFTALKKRCDVG